MKILGSGCARSAKLAQGAEAAAKERRLSYTVGKVTDRDQTIDAGVMMTPARH